MDLFNELKNQQDVQQLLIELDLQETLSDKVIEEDLTNHIIKIYTKYEFQQIKNQEKMNPLIHFQSVNKYLFMAFNPQKQKELGRIIANTEKRSLDKIFETYSHILGELLNSTLTKGKKINAFTHMFGYFKEQLTEKEKELFNKKIREYQESLVQEEVITTMIELWAIRFNEGYLETQTILNPIPLEARLMIQHLYEMQADRESEL